MVFYFPLLTATYVMCQKQQNTALLVAKMLSCSGMSFSGLREKNFDTNSYTIRYLLPK